MRDEFGIRIVQAWGMTETSPLASVAWPQEHMRDWTRGRRHLGGVDQGRAPPARRRDLHRGRVRRRGPGRRRRRWATSPSAVHGSSTATYTGRESRTSPQTGGSRPGTWRSALPTGTSSSPTAPRTSSSPAASGSPRWTWRTASCRWTRSSRQRSSPCRTPSGRSAPWSASCSNPVRRCRWTRCTPTC